MILCTGIEACSYCSMGIVECCYSLHYFSNLFNLQFCIDFSLYQLLSSICALRSTLKLYQLLCTLRSTVYPILSRHYLLLSALYALRCTIYPSSTSYSLLSTRYALRFTIYPPLPKHYLLSSTPCAVRSTL